MPAESGEAAEVTAETIDLATPEIQEPMVAKREEVVVVAAERSMEGRRGEERREEKWGVL